MSAATIQQLADRAASMMEERLGIGGRDLPAKLRRGGRLLPRAVRREAEYLAEASLKAHNPKFLTQIDQGKVAASYDVLVRYLRPLGARDRRIARTLGFLGRLASIVLVTGALVITVLVLRGFL